MSSVALRWDRRFPPAEARGVVVPEMTAAGWAELKRTVGSGRALAVDRGENWVVVRPLDAGPPPWLPDGTFVAPEPTEPRLWLPTHRLPVAPMTAMWRSLEASTGDALSGVGAVVLWPGPPLLVLPLGPAWPVAADDLP